MTVDTTSSKMCHSNEEQMSKRNNNKGLTEVILNETSLDPKDRQRKSELFFKRFRQSFKDHKRYGKADRALNKCREKE